MPVCPILYFPKDVLQKKTFLSNKMNYQIWYRMLTKQVSQILSCSVVLNVSVKTLNIFCKYISEKNAVLKIFGTECLENRCLKFCVMLNGNSERKIVKDKNIFHKHIPGLSMCSGSVSKNILSSFL
jgi:hypothetical protein